MDYRGEYASKAEAHALLHNSGGLVRAAGRAARRVGALLTRDPQLGDVAVVAAGPVVACAIRGRRNWVMRLEPGGLALMPLDRVRVIAAWRL